MTALNSLLARFREMHVAVVGDAMLDTYCLGSSSRLAQEAPVPVVSVTSMIEAPGGAANVAANAAALGAGVSLVGVVGDDAPGARLAALLAERSVDTEGLLHDGSRTTLGKTRVMADSRMVARMDTGTATPVGAPCEEALLSQLERVATSADLLLVSDYGYGVLTPAVRRWIETERPRFRVLSVDAKQLQDYRGAAPTLVKPNWSQALGLIGGGGAAPGEARDTFVADAAVELFEASGASICAVTLDADGAVVLSREQMPLRTRAQAIDNANAIGAGDTYLAGFSLALAAQAALPDAAQFAATAARIVVSRPATVVCTAADLDDFEQPSRVVTRQEAVAAVNGARAAGRRVVLTSGVFDILHQGHVRYLEAARALGDMLVVGVNADASVRALKGAGRPVNPLEDRSRVLAALGCVDLVIPFDELTPNELIGALRPDVFTKGGDYTRDRLPEADLVEDLGGRVVILDYVPGRSTTGMLERIKARPTHQPRSGHARSKVSVP